MNDQNNSITCDYGNESKGLLEVLQCRIGCMYLSDLRIPSNLPLVRHALRKIDAERFALHEWNDAVRYITGKKLSFDQVSDAAGYLAGRRESTREITGQK